MDVLPTSQGFIAQLVEQRTGIAEVMGSNPIVALKSFFQAKKQLLKLLRTAGIIPLISQK